MTQPAVLLKLLLKSEANVLVNSMMLAEARADQASGSRGGRKRKSDQAPSQPISMMSSPIAEVTKSENTLGVTLFVAMTDTSLTSSENAPAITPKTSPSRTTSPIRATN